MKWLFIHLRDLAALCLFILFLHFYISCKYDLHVDAERIIVKAREM